MSDETTPRLDDLQRFADIARFMLDAKQCLKRAEEQIGLTIAANEAKAAAENAQAELAARKADHEAAFAAREAQLDASYDRVLQHEREAAQKLDRVRVVFDELRTLDAQMRRQVLQFSGIPFNVDIQTLPNWQQLEADILRQAGRALRR